MTVLHVIILGIIQGLAELLPVSSSAHVVVAEELLGLDPSAPPMTLLLVMLHTGTMFAVIVYFWRSWRAAYFASRRALRSFIIVLVLATALTGLVGEGVVLVLERTVLASVPHAQIEDLFGNLGFMAPALAAVGVLIILAGLVERRRLQRGRSPPPAGGAGTAGSSASALGAGRTTSTAMMSMTHTEGSTGALGLSVAASVDTVALPRVGAPALAVAPDSDELGVGQAAIIGVVQGLSLPFRGFSRSGATISSAMLLGVDKARAEVFSFALAVVLTPPVVAREALRLLHSQGGAGGADLGAVALRTLLGALVAFLAGLAALRWLSRWLERGRWHLFGVYCLAAAVAVALLHHAGF